MKLGIAAVAPVLLMACSHRQPVAPVRSAFIVTPEYCQESSHQPEGTSLVSLVCISSDGSDVAGVVYDKATWTALEVTASIGSTPSSHKR